MKINVKEGRIIEPPKLDLDKLLDVSSDTPSVSSDTVLAKENAGTTVPCNISKDISKDMSTDTDSISKDMSYAQKYRKSKYKTISLDMHPDEVNTFKAKAKAYGISLTELFRRGAEAYDISKDISKDR